MVCNKCGKPLPGDGAVCNFCGAMMSQNQFNSQSKMRRETNSFQAKLLSDRYGVDKKDLFKKDNAPKDNKLLGAAIILITLLIIVIMVIIINGGR